MIYIEKFNGLGKQPWFYRLRSSNGRILSISEGYSRKWNRDRAVRRLSKLLPGIEVREGKWLG